MGPKMTFHQGLRVPAPHRCRRVSDLCCPFAGKSGRDVPGGRRGSVGHTGGRGPGHDGSQPLDCGRPRIGPPILGERPGLHSRDDQPGCPQCPLLRGRAGSQGGHRLLGQQLPDLHAQPGVPAGLRDRRRRGRTLVDPHAFAAAEAAARWSAGGGHRVAGRIVHGRQRRLRGCRLSLRSARPSRAFGARRRPGACGGG